MSGCQDGSVQLWDSKITSFHRPSVLFRSAHQAQTEVTCVKMLRNDFNLLTRGLDDSMKMWDIRKPQEQPVFTWTNLTNICSKTNICVSPDQTLVLTGTSSKKGQGHGLLVAFDVRSGERAKEIAVSQ